MPDLTNGAIANILGGVSVQRPVLQCIGAKPLQSQQGGSERFRLAVSDGVHWCTAMLATQMNDLMRTGSVVNLSFLCLKDFLLSDSQGKKLIIILDLEPLGLGTAKVGNPTPLMDGRPQQAGSAAAGGYQAPNPQQGGNAQQTQVFHQGSNGTSSASGRGYANGNTYGRAAGPQMPAYGGGNTAGPQIAGGYGQAPDFRAGNAPVARNEAAPRIMPIAALNAYQNRWTIKARITQRSELRRWSNSRGEGKFFSVDLLDAGKGEIRAVAFNDAADKFDGILQPGRVVLISKATLKPKKPGSTYNQTRHDHEMTLDKNTLIEECPDDEGAASIPQICYRFRKIGEAERCEVSTQIDVIGIVESVDQVTGITKRDGGETTKRGVVLRDDSGHSIELTLWGANCTSPGDQLDRLVNAEGEKPVLAAKNVRIGDFGGRNLSTVGTSQLAVNPDHEAAAGLRDWYHNRGGASMQAQRLTELRGGGSGRNDRRVTVSAVEEERLGTSGHPDYVMVVCAISMIKDDNMSYPACTLQYNNRPCAKKLTNNSGDGQAWWCDRCQQEARPEWRYILQVMVEDHTGSLWATAFQEAGAEVMGMAAGALREQGQEDPSAADQAISAAVHSLYSVKLKVAEDSYNDETRIKKNIVRAERVDFAKESRAVLEMIHKLGRGVAAMPPAGAGPAGLGASYPMHSIGMYGSSGMHGGGCIGGGSFAASHVGYEQAGRGFQNGHTYGHGNFGVR